MRIEVLCAPLNFANIVRLAFCFQTESFTFSYFLLRKNPFFEIPLGLSDNFASLKLHFFVCDSLKGVIGVLEGTHFCCGEYTIQYRHPPVVKHCAM